jgi:DNA-binding LytR/AlgR family response regulator
MSSRETRHIQEILLAIKAEMDEVKESVKHPLALPERSRDKIELPDKDGKKRLYSVKNIILVCGAKQYIDVHFVKGHVPAKLTPSGSLGEWKEIFIELGFLQLHRSCLVNPKHIIDCEGSTYCLVLTDGHKFTIQKPYREKYHDYFHGR